MWASISSCCIVGGVIINNLNFLRDVFSHKKILVVGHSGFKGSWLAYTLKLFEAKVFGFSIDEPNDKRHVYHELSINSLVENPNSCLGDVRSAQYSELLKSQNFDFVFHLAAQALVSKSFIDPLGTITTNTYGVLNLLETLRTSKLDSSCIIVTSDKCYLNDNLGKAFKETDPVGGEDPYSASKACAEILFHSYLNSFNNPDANSSVASVRAGNVFGGGDWSDNRIFPDCAREFAQNGSVTLRMPHATRPWTSVHDIICGYLMLAKKLSNDPSQFQGSWNFASRETRTVNQIVSRFRDSYGKGRIIIDPSTSIGKESLLLQIDPSKSEEKLKWFCKYDLDKSIEDAARWYQVQSTNGDVAAHSENYLRIYYNL